MNIKPFRSIDEYDVINLYAFDGATATKGTFVELKTWNLSAAHSAWSNVNAGAAYNNTFSKRYAVNARVQATLSGSQKVLGMLIYDVTDADENGELLRFMPKYKKDAMNAVESGEAVPIVTRGIVEIIGFQGVPDVGSGAVISNSGDGSIAVALPSVTAGKVGKFLSTTGVDGYALLKIEL